ncbi:Type II/IV secretion system protein TadC, associated with Flp pilus assembly [Myxococcus hansupus]|uniref:Type II/IV secretion system protein TadC, associated with Flp pilus assembly n=1 Tax=Pseudomyxococcus hansupus TaxID=1297742 RepID=A0A0H4WVH8_9BACT|nr:type II secretion system F family protein [Myxococcus hansupus]AKQ65335.1 Type II/IV secretion system protein TadC, associated with Flp pilus assembly [Myxococcus hansupus]
MDDVLTPMLIGSSALLFAGAVGFLGLGLYQTMLERFLTEVRDESTGGMKGFGSVAIRRLGSMNRRFMWPGYEAKARRNLIKAGEPQMYKPEDIMALQEVSAVVGLLMGLILLNGFGVSLVWSPLFLLFGMYYPLMWLNDQVKKRHLLISRALPYSLDLLTLSVEAGLDFTAALAKVVEKGKAGPLREELQLVLKQLKMGKTREEGLKSMIVRVDLPPLTTFVTALIQADKMGTSLGKVLRIQSTQMRIDRTQRAEKLAGEAPVKMLFPLIACIFPTVFMVLFGPIVFQFMFGNISG